MCEMGMCPKLNKLITTDMFLERREENVFASQIRTDELQLADRCIQC